MSAQKRTDRLQIMLGDDEIRAIDDWRFRQHIPTRAAAIRELLRRGIAAEGLELPDKTEPRRRRLGLVDDI